MRPLARDLKDNETSNETSNYSFPLKLSYEDNMKEASERSFVFFVEFDIRIDLEQPRAILFLAIRICYTKMIYLIYIYI
jgi:hypothetical protein